MIPGFKKEIMKILNLYAGIGGNRKLWTLNGDEHKITAVEIDPDIAKIYQDFFPDDTMVVGDAHSFLLENHKEYDFIWSSPPCPTHSILRTLNKTIVYPDMGLYQEIILLKKWFKGKWLVENVKPYYNSLIYPSYIVHRHAFWCNFHIDHKIYDKLETCKKPKEREFLQDKLDINIDKYKNIDKRKLLRNCVVPELGLHILNMVLKSNIKQSQLFV